ncbi:unnamed protein product [Trichobilharzia regenti]|nr:unnamed protein product [Trichobilharzia regenti]
MLDNRKTRAFSQLLPPLSAWVQILGPDGSQSVAMGQLACCQERPQEFDFTCEYRSGKRYAFSRLLNFESTVNALLGRASDID